MEIKYLFAGALAALGFSLVIQSAFADSIGQYPSAQSGALTLIHGGGGGGGSGGHGGGFGGAGGHGWSGGGIDRGWSGSHSGGISVPHSKSMGSAGTRGLISRPGTRALRIAPRRVHGIRGWHGHRRGYWRGGLWYSYDCDIWGDCGWEVDSCYADCLSEGYGPAYCQIHAWDDCD